MIAKERRRIADKLRILMCECTGNWMVLGWVQREIDRAVRAERRKWRKQQDRHFAARAKGDETVIERAKGERR